MIIEPSPIRNVEYINLSPSSLRISWDPPSTPNGFNITYKVLYQQLTVGDILPTEVCTSSGIAASNFILQSTIDATVATSTVSLNDSCPCLSTPVATVNQAKIADIRRENQNFFEYLVNEVFYRKTPAPKAVSTANATLSTTGR